ncbi:MAG TPA: regulatory protein RecX [Gemmatimonadales bacterium]|nr:regulatory protein RecX [Gemmatimonadales bacterium]
MAVLTGLAPDPHRPGYRVLEVDRGRFASLPEGSILDLGLALGTVLTPERLAHLQYLADIEAAHRAAVRAQTRRPHAVADLRRRLIQKQHPPAAVDAALERLAVQGLLDDFRFAEHYVATRAARGRGPARLVTDLLRQGLDRRTAEGAVRHTLSEEAIDLTATLRAVAQRRAAQLRGLPIPTRRRRLMAFLSRRGYQGPEVRSLIEDLVVAGEVT